MILLDTDHVSLLQRPESPEGQAIVQRLRASADRDIATTVVTVEEQMRGWLAAIARHREPEQQSAYYDKLVAFIRFFDRWRIVPFQEAAVHVFRDLRQARVRVATTDLKIAAIAIAADAMLLSRNLRDFQRVPGLRVEDWTGP
jgi:tRNA(fMet)-specific endonuclease VapC